MPGDPAKGVFISYRRDDGAVLARLVHEVIAREEGAAFDIFLDVDHVDSGHFPARLQEAISTRLHFILVCAAGKLLRPEEGREDWVRKEIECALKLRRHIIPLVGPGFLWPEAKNLPHEFHFLNTLQRIDFDNEHWSEPKTGTRSKLLQFLKVDQAKVRTIYEDYEPGAETQASKLEEEGEVLLESKPKEAEERFKQALQLRERDRLDLPSYQTDDRVARVRELLARTMTLQEPKSKPAIRELTRALSVREEIRDNLTETDPRRVEQAIRIVRNSVILAELHGACEESELEQGHLRRAADLAIETLPRVESHADFEGLREPVVQQAEREWVSESEDSRLRSIQSRTRVLEEQRRIISVGAGSSRGFTKDYGDEIMLVARRQRQMNRNDEAADLLRSAIQTVRPSHKHPRPTEEVKPLCDLLELAAETERARHDVPAAVSYLAESLEHRRAVAEVDATHNDLRKLTVALAGCIDAWVESPGATECPAQVAEALRTWHQLSHARVESLGRIEGPTSAAEARELQADIAVMREHCRQLADKHRIFGSDWARSDSGRWLLQVDPSLARFSDRLRTLEDRDELNRKVRPEERGLITSADRRYQVVTPITKPQFKLGLECIHKLRHARQCLPQDISGDDLMSLQAEGGATVKALQRAIEPGMFLGRIALDEAASESLRHVAAAVQTVREGALRQSLYEVTVEIGGFLARLDLVRVLADRIELVEIKAKSKPQEGMLTMRGGVRSEWLPYLQDVGFQHHLLRQWIAHHCGTIGLPPNFPISARLLLVDSAGAASDADVFDRENFRVADADELYGVHATVEYVGARPPAATALLCEIPVDTELALVQSNTGSSVDPFRNRGIAECMAVMRSMVDSDQWPDPSEALGVKCISCEFRSPTPDLSGFARCWGMHEFPQGHVAELARVSDGQFRTAIATCGRSAMISDLEEGSLRPIQLPQWRTATSGRPEVEQRFAADPIAAMLPSGWPGPVWFLDFETASYPIPCRVGGHPYEHVPFQFEGHRLPHPAAQLIERVRLDGFLDLEAADPRRRCVDSLRAQLGTEGPVFHWGWFEPSVLRQLRASLVEDRQAGDDDRLAFIDSLADTSGRGAGRLVDLMPIAREAFYHPMLRGSYSIKRVVPIAWAQPSIRDAFKDGHGAAGDPDSYSGDDDPYEGLAAVSTGALADGGGGDSASSVVTALVDGDAIRNGGMAMLAYHRTRMFGEPHDPAIARQLRRYCGLDSAAIVMVYGLMRDVVATWPRSSRD